MEEPILDTSKSTLPYWVGMISNMTRRWKGNQGNIIFFTGIFFWGVKFLTDFRMGQARPSFWKLLGFFSGDIFEFLPIMRAGDSILSLHWTMGGKGGHRGGHRAKDHSKPITEVLPLFTMHINVRKRGWISRGNRPIVYTQRILIYLILRYYFWKMAQSWFLRKRGLRNNENAGLTLQKKGLLERARLLNRRKFKRFCLDLYWDYPVKNLLNLSREVPDVGGGIGENLNLLVTVGLGFFYSQVF